MTETWTDGNSIGGSSRRVQRRHDRGNRPLRRMRQHQPARRGRRLQLLPGTGPALPRLRRSAHATDPRPGRVWLDMGGLEYIELAAPG
jgi:hypothetical protein